jgi:predicted kinase
MGKKVINLSKKRANKAAKRREKKKVTDPNIPVVQEEQQVKKLTDVKNTQFIIMCGNIGTGKTTAAKQLVDAHGFYRVSHDDILTMLRNYSYDKEDVVMYHDIEKMIVGALVKFRKDIVIDRTNMTKVDRKRWIELAKYYDYYANLQRPYNNITPKIMDFGQGNDESLARVVQREYDKELAKKEEYMSVADSTMGELVFKEGLMTKVREKWEKVYGFMYNGWEAPTLDEGVTIIKDMVTGDIYEADRDEQGNENTVEDLDEDSGTGNDGASD